MDARMCVVGSTIAFLLIVPAAHAAAPPQKPRPKSCWDTAVTQPELTACASSEAKAADAHLNKAYQEVLTYLEGAERAKLVAAQRAWIAFRDADCSFWGYGGGSIAPMNQAACVAMLSEQRAKELDNWPPNSDRGAISPLPRSQQR